MSDNSMKNKALFGLVTSVAAFVLIMGLAIWRGNGADSSPPVLTLQATTTLENSGVLKHLTEAFSRDAGIDVRTLVFGTGQVLKNARRGDADVVIVHDTESEKAFVAAGFGTSRHEVMFNDFVLVGPDNDPAGVGDLDSLVEAFGKIASQQQPFVSRGDDSGTHKAELRLWKSAGVEMPSAQPSWYWVAGSGVGATLAVAENRNAYSLVDRASWAAYQLKGALDVLVENEPPLRNLYGVILVAADRENDAGRARGSKFIEWLVGEPGQKAIADFRVDGKQVYFPVKGGGV